VAVPADGLCSSVYCRAWSASIGVADSSDVRLLSQQGAHLTVNTTKISVQR
jgi:hypothetical protein